MPGYVRYVDDFLLFSNDKEQLAEWKAAVSVRLELARLAVNRRKSRVFPVSEGVPFLGFRVFPNYRRLLPGAVTRARRRLMRLAEEYRLGQIGMVEVRRSASAWIAHAGHGNTQGLRRQIFRALHFGRTVDSVLRGGSWNNNHDNAACSYRNNNNPENRNNNIGFRCAKTLLAFACCYGGKWPEGRCFKDGGRVRW